MARRWMIPMTVLVVAAGCEGPVDVESELTREEATVLLEGILALGERGELTLIERSGNVVVASCPLDGRVTFRYTYYSRQVADTMWIDEAETVVPDGCGFAWDGLDFRMDGGPEYHREAAREINWRGEHRAAAGSLKGRVVWHLGRRTGDCAINLALSLKPDNTDTGVYRGNACGHEGVEIELSLGVVLLN